MQALALLFFFLLNCLMRSVCLLKKKGEVFNMLAFLSVCNIQRQEEGMWCGNWETLFCWLLIVVLWKFLEILWFVLKSNKQSMSVEFHLAWLFNVSVFRIVDEHYCYTSAGFDPTPTHSLLRDNLLYLFLTFFSLTNEAKQPMLTQETSSWEVDKPY